VATITNSWSPCHRADGPRCRQLPARAASASHGSATSFAEKACNCLLPAGRCAFHAPATFTS